MTINTKSWIEIEVDRLFDKMGAARGCVCQNPINSANFVWGRDPIEPQKRDAVLALLARAHFSLTSPSDVPALPLSHDDIEHMRASGGLSAVVGFCARSLALRHWDIGKHPSFMDFACGLMASNSGSWNLEKDEQLQRRFPARRLEGMGPDLNWRPPGEHLQIMASYNRNKTRLAA